MNRIQSEHHFVDRAGYKQISPSARCILKSRSTPVSAIAVHNREPVPSSGGGVPAPAPKRSRILIRSEEDGAVKTTYISGDGVNNVEGYPLREGESIDLPVSARVRVFAVAASGVDPDPDLRTLELG